MVNFYFFSGLNDVVFSCFSGLISDISVSARLALNCDYLIPILLQQLYPDIAAAISSYFKHCLSVSGEIPGVLGFKETKLSISFYRRSRVHCCRPLLCAITLDEANPQGLWLQIEQSPSPM
jgi:hypothetical protein